MDTSSTIAVILICVPFFTLLLFGFIYIVHKIKHSSDDYEIRTSDNKKRYSDEQVFEGPRSYLNQDDSKFIMELVKIIFNDEEDYYSDAFYNEKVQRILDCKEIDGISKIDVRYFFKNQNYTLFHYHITKDIRSREIHYYCQKYASKVIKMPKTEYSKIDNYIAYFNCDYYEHFCFLMYIMKKYPMTAGLNIFGFSSPFVNKKQEIRSYEHTKDYVFEYIYRMLSNTPLCFYPNLAAINEVSGRMLKIKGYQDTSEWKSKEAELKAEMQNKGILAINYKNENERKLFFLVKEIYDDAIYQYHDKWLGNKSLDIYIPCKKIAIEYQGKQHYEPIKMFGGEKGFKEIQKRDEIKRDGCKRRGIKLIEWPYDLEVTKENLINLLEEE